MAPDASVVVIGIGVVPLVVLFPPIVPFAPPIAPATVELAAPTGTPPVPTGAPPVAVEVELTEDTLTTVAVPVVVLPLDATITVAAPVDEVRPVETTTVAVPVEEVEVAVTVAVEDDAETASRTRGQQNGKNRDLGKHTLAEVGAIAEDAVYICTRWASFHSAIVDTVHEVHLSAQTIRISPAVGAAEPGGLSEHVLDACLLCGRQQQVRRDVRPSAKEYLRRKEEGYSRPKHSAPQLHRRKARQRRRRISFRRGRDVGLICY